MFRIENGKGDARIIELVEGEILTRATYDRVKTEKGCVIPDIERDILKLAVIERHRGTGNTGLGLVRGFGIQEGAMASSVAHDSHNVIVVGTNDRDMCHAVETLRDMGGGMAAVRAEKALARVPLPVAGLMSVEPMDVLVKQLKSLEQAVASLGCSLSDPFMLLSFLALPVIPQLRLTDRGLVDVDAFDFVPLFVQKNPEKDL
jgi:adenine deaminase